MRDTRFPALVRRLVMANLLAASIGCASSRRAERSAPSYCFAPAAAEGTGAVLWTTSASRLSAGIPVPRAVAANALAGAWDVLTVTTQGVASPEARRWQLRLVPTSPDVWYQCAFGPCRSDRVAVVAAGAPLGGPAAFDGLAAAARRSTDPDRVEAQYDSSGNSLTLRFGPPMFDAGTFYTVTEVSDTLMVGRWTDGSSMAFEVVRGGTNVLEHPEGYFCGRRLLR